jgi:hypothetical protein
LLFEYLLEYINDLLSALNAFIIDWINAPFFDMYVSELQTESAILCIKILYRNQREDRSLKEQKIFFSMCNSLLIIWITTHSRLHEKEMKINAFDGQRICFLYQSSWRLNYFSMKLLIKCFMNISTRRIYILFIRTMELSFPSIYSRYILTSQFATY